MKIIYCGICRKKTLNWSKFFLLWKDIPIVKLREPYFESFLLQSWNYDASNHRSIKKRFSPTWSDSVWPRIPKPNIKRKNHNNRHYGQSLTLKEYSLGKLGHPQNTSCIDCVQSWKCCDLWSACDKRLTCTIPLGWHCLLSLFFHE